MGRAPGRKPRNGPPSAPPSQGRRSPPPERTGLETAYLGALEATKRELVVGLRGGQTVRGRIQAFDREAILLETAAGRTNLVRKADIRYVEEC